ncbi:hypothetical protein OIU77_006524 [Salix suchowensis]|uniref:BHLH domain-containing protein n=1 Tax=Salix suchowensis TaxID=1278906 RepID=A0ABQ9AMY9_9ROSI|nr:hypothetical protein OIU77_006524 [Salix suchowensis]
MMENKRSPCSVDHGTLTALATKRHKPDFSVSTKERKEKLGERIVALQQLVSPYGKTDTASVLMEAMEYIRFLHEQVQVLSAPYLQGTPTAQIQELGQHSLESKGLCLVPISYTAGIASSNVSRYGGVEGNRHSGCAAEFCPADDSSVTEFNLGEMELRMLY